MSYNAKILPPFEFGVPVSGETFAGRTEETRHLCANFRHGINTILISPRRTGKTSLVNQTIQLSENESLRIARFDALKCASDEEFLTAFATAVIRAASVLQEKQMALTQRFLARFAPKISLDTDPTNDFSVSLEIKNIRSEAEKILQLPEDIAAAENIRIVVCIDEFQQIREFDDSLSFQKLLRTVWQLQKHVSYCLCGSQGKMERLFGPQNSPFYRFGDMMHLQRIRRDDWVEFIIRRFRDSGKSITEAMAGRIADAVENHPAYVQHLAWYVWLETSGEVREESCNVAIKKMLDAYHPIFAERVSRLTLRQRNFLKALDDGVQTGFTRQKTLEQYRLGNSANVARVKKSLIEKALIALVDTDRWVITDPVFRLWLRQRFWCATRPSF